MILLIASYTHFKALFWYFSDLFQNKTSLLLWLCHNIGLPQISPLQFLWILTSLSPGSYSCFLCGHKRVTSWSDWPLSAPRWDNATYWDGLAWWQALGLPCNITCPIASICCESLLLFRTLCLYHEAFFIYFLWFSGYMQVREIWTLGHYLKVQN